MRADPRRKFTGLLAAIIVTLGSLPVCFGAVSAAPQIKVSENGNTIVNGDLGSRGYFGTASLSNEQLTHTFRITNIGTTQLNLTGTPAVQILYNTAEFKVITQPQSSLAPGSSTDFTVSFDPEQPNQRMATVSIASNDAPNNPYTFVISGFGDLLGFLPQAIYFTAPSVVYYPSQSSLPLEARTTTGASASFAVLSGPASIVGGSTLMISGTGTIQVQATKEGNHVSSAAAPVTVTITVKPDPTSLTLINLNQTYDGTPRAISTIKSVGATTITYKVGATYVTTPPTNAGSYPVKAVDSVGSKTGTLVIAKAPLFMSCLNRRKFAGQANPQLEWGVTGFQSTDQFDVIKGTVSTKTTATKTSPGGLYPITPSGGTAVNYTIIYSPGTLFVESFAGTYEALLLDSDSLIVGKVSLTVDALAAKFTGKLYAATETAALPLLGNMSTDFITELSTGTVTVTKGDNTYVISFTVPLTGPVPATVTRNGSLFGSATDCQKLLVLPTGQKVPYAGAYTAILEPATPAGATVPAGAGWATVNISTAAVVTFTGALGDGTKFTAAVSPSAGPGYRLFVQPYTAARAQSYLAGTFTLLPHPVLTSLRQVPMADLTWKKVGLPADASYRAGFSPVTTVLTIDPWIKPATATPLKTLLGLPGVSFNVSASPTGLTSDADMPTAVSLSSANAVTVTAPSSNLTKWKTTLTTATGAFTGSFEVPSGAKKVTVSFSGVLRQPPSNTTSAADPLIGDGAFILPGATATSEKQTGEVLFQRP